MRRSKIVPLALAASMAISSAAAALAGDSEISPSKGDRRRIRRQDLHLTGHRCGGAGDRRQGLFRPDRQRNGVVAYEVKTAKTGALEMVSVDINAGNVIKVTPIDAKADDNEQSD